MPFIGRDLYDQLLRQPLETERRILQAIKQYVRDIGRRLAARRRVSSESARDQASAVTSSGVLNRWEGFVGRWQQQRDHDLLTLHLRTTERRSVRHRLQLRFLLRAQPTGGSETANSLSHATRRNSHDKPAPTANRCQDSDKIDLDRLVFSARQRPSRAWIRNNSIEKTMTCSDFRSRGT